MITVHLTRLRMRTLLLTSMLLSAACTMRGPEPGRPPAAGGADVSEPTAETRAPGTRATVPPNRVMHFVIDSIADAPPLHRTHWGIQVVDAATGAVLYSRNAERHFIPASNMKLVVGTAALALFGEEHRYATPVLSRGRRGDRAEAVIVVGSGDPTWSERFHDDAAAPLDSIAAIVAAAGIRSADELVVDASLFTDAPVLGAWEVGDLPWQYAPPVAPFAVAEGTFRLIVTGGAAPGDPASAYIDGPVPQPLRLDVITDSAGARATLSIDYTARRDTVHATGTVGAGAADTSTLAVTRPAEAAAAALVGALERHGVSVASVRVIRDTAAAAAARAGSERIGEYASAPMSDIVAAILQPSQNWIAEQVLKTLGAAFAGEGSWSGGQDVARGYLYDVVGIDSGAVNLRDASGLSAQNLLTPAATVMLLRHARAQPWGPAWRRALAAPGLEGSTLSSRLGTLEGRMAGKTGTISNVNSLSGYLETGSGRTLIFSIMSNGSGLPAARVRAAIDAMMIAIDRYAASAT